MTPATFDPLAALRVLTDAEVAFVVIGGYAAEILGAPVMTNDLDICYERSRGNLERLAEALRQLGAKLRVAKVDEDLPFILDAQTLANGDSFTFVTDLGSLDVLATPSGTSGYRDLSSRAALYELPDGLQVRVVDLGDLMRMKRASGRAKDRIHLEVLAAVQDMVDQAEEPPGHPG
ncbi:MAG: hypothetical protein M3137_06125 [Actinomycetota bacterium]|nr:hypothetical protein [Actinomycetota bacterium]